MTEYRRAFITGGCYYFTVNCAQRHGNTILTDNIDFLKKSFHKVKTDHPFTINAIVILPEHLHCIWTLPPGDADYKTRWGLIKAGLLRGELNNIKCKLIEDGLRRRIDDNLYAKHTIHKVIETVY